MSSLAAKALEFAVAILRYLTVCTSIFSLKFDQINSNIEVPNIPVTIMVKELSRKKRGGHKSPATWNKSEREAKCRDFYDHSVLVKTGYIHNFYRWSQPETETSQNQTWVGVI